MLEKIYIKKLFEVSRGVLKSFTFREAMKILFWGFIYLGLAQSFDDYPGQARI